MPPGTEIEDLQQRVQRLEDERSILQTMYRYVHAIDYGPAEQWADCFTEEGVYATTFPDGTNREFGGRDTLTAFAEEHPTPPDAYFKHFIIAPIIEIEGDEARVSSIMGRIDDPGDGPLIDVFGRYEDELVRCDDGRWRFVRRHSVVEALAPSFSSDALDDD